MKTIKLKKGQFLYFIQADRLEEITKSSNNAKDGMLRTYLAKQRRSKEYTVKHITAEILDGNIKLFEAAQIKDGKILENQ